MPTYEYQCGTCGHRFEKFQSFSEEPIKTCPVCAEPVKKVFTPAGIIFKGSGWYITDSKKASSNGTATDSSSKTPETGAKPEGTSAAEPAPKAVESKSSEGKSSEAAA